MRDFEPYGDQGAGGVMELFPCVTKIIYVNFEFKRRTWWGYVMELLALNLVEMNKDDERDVFLK